MGRRSKEPKDNSCELINYRSLDGELKQAFDETVLELMKLSIIKLREIGEKTPGVHAPTTKSKLDLVRCIAAMRVANVRYIPPGKYKLGPITKEDIESLVEDYTYKTYVVKPIACHGMLAIRKDGAWLQKSLRGDKETDIFVPMLLVNENELKPGDVISGKARLIPAAGRYGMYKLSTINGSDVSKFKRSDVEPAIEPKEIIDLAGGTSLEAIKKVSPFYIGQRKLILGLGGHSTTPLAAEISNALAKEGFETLNIFLDVAPEEAAHLALPENSIVLDYESHDEAQESVWVAIEYAKNKAVSGGKLAIVVSNIDSLPEKIQRALLGSGKNTEKGSLTVIGLTCAIEISQSINKLSCLVNSIAFLRKSFNSFSPLIDIQNSFSTPSPDQSTLNLIRQRINTQYISCEELISFTRLYIKI